MARESAKKAIERKAAGASGAPAERAEGGSGGGGGSAAMTLIPIIELCHYCPGIVTALGVSTGLAGGTIMKSGTPAQMERWGLDLMTFDKVGAWAITEPDSGSDALGGMKSTAVRDGDEYVLNGNKTFITNGPFADTIVFYAKLDDGSDTPLRQRPGADVHPRFGHARAGAVQALPQDGPALVAHRRAVPVRRAGRTRAAAGRDRGRAGRQRGPGERQGQLRDRAGRGGGDVARVDRGVPQAVDPVRQGPAVVGAADLGVPAHPTEAGEDGDRPAERREPRVPPRRDGGRRGSP